MDANSAHLPFCCGVMEAGNFGDINSNYHEHSANDNASLLEDILSIRVGFPVIFNFVQYKDWNGEFDENYEYDELRGQVMHHPNAKHMCTFINPNSENRVDSWIILNNLRNDNDDNNE